ncbi:FtsX-like permease family protein [Nocardioides sp. MAH-18]|uniref:FtsX-like permease family protein n=1 Tax=Nocardioides agri TaxID=2682843 RepID=A0A6L6XZD2_9ACTN|nr:MULTISPECIES: ABC transporter permease [unclassified Nocardioides]MBA2955896.1 ABC transporter permease [Nocardioides sp. CGMCC 1.13656]MVQ50745.1 FtsX-like permease family protein [Nocardioides sp. MAH-18]
MLTATFRSMVAHKVRLLLTTASIALGVALLAGTLILTNTMGIAFDMLFGKISSGTDAVVRTEAPYTSTEGVGTDRGPIAASVLDKVRHVDGVRAAEGSVRGYALLTDTDGRAITTNGGAPTNGYSMPADDELRGEVELLSGHAPQGPHEVAIDATSAEDHDIALGSTISVLFQGPTQEFTVVGTVGYGDGIKDLGGTTSAYFDTATAQQVLGSPGEFDGIDVSAEPGVSQAELADRLSAVIPRGTEAVTGAAVAQENADATKENFKIVGIVFGVFAAIALFVGSFIIWNTFTMTVTQRSREIALLRAIGARRRQVLGSLLLEAVVLGLVASAAGIGLGVLVAKGLKALMDAVGLALPFTALQIPGTAIWASLVVGTGVTVVAALVPARRATKVLPIEALRESTPGAEKPSVVRGVIGLSVLGAGTAGMLWSLYGGAPFKVFGLGLLAAMVGVLVALPLAVRPLAALVAAPLKLRGLPGELARQNATRNPRRTSATAAALMIGLTLVVSMGVFASSLKSSFGEVLADRTDADLYVATSSAQAPGFSPAAVDAVKAVDGVAEVSASGWGQAHFDGEPSGYSSVDPSSADEVMNLDVSQGSLADLGEDGVVVSKSAATSHGWKLGDTVSAQFAQSGDHTLRIVGVYDAKGWIGDDFVISIAEQNAFAGPQLVSTALVTLDRGADAGRVQDAIDAALADHPDAQVLDKDGFQKVATGFIDSLLAFVTVMLALAVLIALLGIVNTLALSVFERTRELGLLRAVGMTRGQVRAMVRWESAVISLIGAVGGTALGVGIGLALSQVLKDEGIKSVSVPIGQIVVYLVLAAAAGVLAAVGPARSAAKVDVLRAVVAD